MVMEQMKSLKSRTLFCPRCLDKLLAAFAEVHKDEGKKKVLFNQKSSYVKLSIIYSDSPQSLKKMSLFIESISGKVVVLIW